MVVQEVTDDGRSAAAGATDQDRPFCVGHC
jgi:hypothetical protein